MAGAHEQGAHHPQLHRRVHPHPRRPRRNSAHHPSRARPRRLRATAVARRLGPRIHPRGRRAHLLLPRQAHRAGRASRSRRPVARRAAGHRRAAIRRSTKSAAANASACSAAPRAWSRCSRATNIATATGCGSTNRLPCRSRPSSATQSGEVIEQIVFSNIDLPERIPDSMFKPQVDASNYRWLRADRQAGEQRRRRPCGKP